MAAHLDRLRGIGDDLDALLIKRINGVLTAADAKADDPEQLDALLLDQLPALLGSLGALSEATRRLAALEKALERGVGDTAALTSARDELIENLAALTGELRAGQR